MKAAEFFAGMGLVRAGLEQCGVKTVFANDIDRTKATLYQENWGDGELHIGDVRQLAGDDIPTVDLATASFPCVDLSLAGKREGLVGTRSGVVFEFLRILDEMGRRAPDTVLIENVPGFLTTNSGQDFRSVTDRLKALNYQVGYTCVDAAAFVPQSRRRIFLIGSRKRVPVLADPPPPRDELRLAEIVIEEDDEWWKPPRLGRFLVSLSPLQSERVASYSLRARVSYFGAYRRTRNGRAVWEVRADEKAGALRTTRGGSAKQAVLRAGCGGVAARWMNLREYALLQGAGSLTFNSVTTQQAMFALGDAVCVPVVQWVALNYLFPLMDHA